MTHEIPATHDPMSTELIAALVSVIADISDELKVGLPLIESIGLVTTNSSIPEHSEEAASTFNVILSLGQLLEEVDQEKEFNEWRDKIQSMYHSAHKREAAIASLARTGGGMKMDSRGGYMDEYNAKRTFLIKQTRGLANLVQQTHELLVEAVNRRRTQGF